MREELTRLTQGISLLMYLVFCFIILHIHCFFKVSLRDLDMDDEQGNNSRIYNPFINAAKAHVICSELGAEE